MMFTISPLLAAIALTTVPLSIWLMKFIGGRARPRFIAQWRHTGSLNAQAEEVFTGHAIVKSFGRQREVESRFRDDNDELYEASFGAQFTSSLIQPLMVFMGNIQFVLIAVVGGLRISSGAITVGDMQAIIQYARQFSQPLTQLASMTATFQSGIASLERVLELLDADEQSPEQADSVDPAPVRGRVVFDDVHFSYDPDTPLIEGLDVVAEPGQTIAIVGPTGAGKTTLVNLIMRFYDLDSGTISLDGRDIASDPRHELRSRIGMVLQDTWLFGGTIRDNLAYGNPDATDEQILEAARVTYVDRFVHSLPDGYDTVINDEGDNISAGEKQLHHDRPRVPGRPVDPDPRRGHQLGRHPHRGADPGGDERAAAQRTSFVIAHRLSTIRGADVILVMDGRPHRRAGQPRRTARPRRPVRPPLQRPVRRPGDLTRPVTRAETESPGSRVSSGRLLAMSFGQPSGPSASVKQVQELLTLLHDAGHADFRDARGPMGFSQRQAAGKFTRDEAESFIDRLQATAADESATDDGGPPARLSAVEQRCGACRTSCSRPNCSGAVGS